MKFVSDTLCNGRSCPYCGEMLSFEAGSGWVLGVFEMTRVCSRRECGRVFTVILTVDSVKGVGDDKATEAAVHGKS